MTVTVTRESSGDDGSIGDDGDARFLLRFRRCLTSP